VGVITLDVLPGLVIGIVSMLLLVVYNASRPHLSVLGAVPGSPGAYGDIGRHPDYMTIPDVLVLRLEAPLFYANASLVRNVDRHEPVHRDGFARLCQREQLFSQHAR